MRIIVEGPDGAGKTSLIGEIHAHFENMIDIRNDKESKQDFDTWWDEILALQTPGQIPLHDRFFYSELVYGPVLRGRIAVGPAVTAEIKEYLRRTAMLIYVRPPMYEIRDNVKKKPQMKGVIGRIIDITTFYDQLFRLEAEFYGRRFYEYDYTMKTIEPAAVLEAVRRYVSGEVT